jgi:hypothetical protein
MARSFSHDLPVSGSPSDAQARVRGVLIERLRRSAKMRLASEQPNALSFRPRWSWPLALALYRVISGEVVNVRFSAADGGTRVAVSGKVAGNAEVIADQEFWAELLATA